MAFKIASIANMNNISSKMTSNASEATQNSQSVTYALDELVGIISGKGVEQSLQKLKEAINSETTLTVNLLNDVSTFIKTQTSSYSTNEENVASSLSDVENMLGNIQIN